MKRHQKTQILFFIAAVVWGLLIFYLSSIPNLQSALPSWQDMILRKLAHIFVFFILTYFLISSFVKYKRFYIYFVIVAAIAYAFIDEYHQVFVPFRYGNAKDILIDSLGVLFGAALYSTWPPHKILTRFAGASARREKIKKS
jgi:VanZ family protein